MPLSYDELTAQYRASLRREVQLKARCDELERRLLVESGRQYNAAQLIINDLAQMKRESREQQTGHELDRIAHEARPAIHHNGVVK